MQSRRSDYDVTNTVQVSSVASVRQAVEGLFKQAWPGPGVERLGQAFADFERLFSGQFPGYYGCDTVYHDMQHSLDDTLAMARLLVGYDRTHAADQRLGGDRALLGIVVALFHDSGYIRRVDETNRNGAEFTLTHVSRSAQFLTHYMPTIGLANWVTVATQIVHFSGYEVPFEQIRLDEPRDRRVGHLLGTADLLAQMSDRCYLEKCRDRLYPEFVLGGVAMSRSDDGDLKVRYGSGLDILRQTPEFFEDTMRTRLDGEFGGAYRYAEALFGGRNPYMEAIERNLEYLEQVLRTGRWSLLRRTPPCFTWERNPLQNMRALVIDSIRTAVDTA
jgi:hypothetical protein